MYRNSRQIAHLLPSRIRVKYNWTIRAGEKLTASCHQVVTKSPQFRTVYSKDKPCSRVVTEPPSNNPGDRPIEISIGNEEWCTHVVTENLIQAKPSAPINRHTPRYRDVPVSMIQLQERRIHCCSLSSSWIGIVTRWIASSRIAGRYCRSLVVTESDHSIEYFNQFLSHSRYLVTPNHLWVVVCRKDEISY